MTPTQITVTIRYFAAAKAAAGLEQEELTVRTGAVLRDLLTVASELHDELAVVLPRCSFLINEFSAAADAPLSADAVVDVLPPFAGG